MDGESGFVVRRLVGSGTRHERIYFPRRDRSVEKAHSSFALQPKTGKRRRARKNKVQGGGRRKQGGQVFLSRSDACEKKVTKEKEVKLRGFVINLRDRKWLDVGCYLSNGVFIPVTSEYCIGRNRTELFIPSDAIVFASNQVN